MKYISIYFLLVAATCWAGPYSIEFDHAVSLTGKAMIKTEEVFTELVSSTRQWETVEVDEQLHDCYYRINILGRDMALENKNIGEHYYGNMWFTCKETELIPFESYDFQTFFSRVLILGVRNCVQSETTVDQDYCNLTVVAFRKENDMRLSRGDLFRSDDDDRDFYRISSTQAQNIIQSYQLIPAGLNTSLVDSYQIFSLSMGKDADTFFIERPSNSSNFPSGKNHYLNLLSGGSTDQTTETEIESILSQLYALMGVVESSTDPQQSFQQNISLILPEFLNATKKLLTVIGPVDFFSLENKIVEFEQALIQLASLYDPNITDQSSFTGHYANQFAELNRVMPYLQNRGLSYDQLPIIGLTSDQTEETSSLESGLNLEEMVDTFNNVRDQQIRYDAFEKYYQEHKSQFSYQDIMYLLKNANIGGSVNILIENYYFDHKSDLSITRFSQLVDLLKSWGYYDSNRKNGLDQTRDRIRRDWNKR